MERTNVPSSYLKKLGELSGLTQKQIEEELKERELFLRKLIEKNIRSMEQVSREMQKFLIEKRE